MNSFCNLLVFVCFHLILQSNGQNVSVIQAPGTVLLPMQHGRAGGLEVFAVPVLCLLPETGENAVKSEQIVKKNKIVETANDLPDSKQLDASAEVHNIVTTNTSIKIRDLLDQAIPPAPKIRPPEAKEEEKQSLELELPEAPPLRSPFPDTPIRPAQELIPPQLQLGPSLLPFLQRNNFRSKFTPFRKVFRNPIANLFPLTPFPTPRRRRIRPARFPPLSLMLRLAAARAFNPGPIGEGTKDGSVLQFFQQLSKNSDALLPRKFPISRF